MTLKVAVEITTATSVLFIGVCANFKKSEINTYAWNFNMYDTSSER